MKSLIEWLNESRGQRISERPYNRPYNRDEEIAQNKSRLKAGSANIKSLKDAVKFCNELNTNFNKVKPDFIKLSEISKKFNIDVQLALCTHDNLSGYPLFISADDLMNNTDLSFNCVNDAGYIDDQTDVKNYLEFIGAENVEEAWASIGFGSDADESAWPCFTYDSGSNWKYHFWDTVDRGYVICYLAIDTSKCDNVIKKSIERILSGLKNKKGVYISSGWAKEYFNMSDLLKDKDKDNVHTNKKSNLKDLIILFNEFTPHKISYSGQLKSLIKAFDKL